MIDVRDCYEALQWALARLEAEGDPVAELYLQHLRELRDEVKREAGR